MGVSVWAPRGDFAREEWEAWLRSRGFDGPFEPVLAPSRVSASGDGDTEVLVCAPWVRGDKFLVPSQSKRRLREAEEYELLTSDPAEWA